LILIRVTAIDENDSSTYSQVFEYSEESFDTIFAPSVDRIKEKLRQGLKINLYECVAMYCDYVVSRMRKNDAPKLIKHDLRSLLSHHNVMTGVPETLRNTTFQVELNKARCEAITIVEPIIIPHYVMKSGE
jgi:urease gamma subunit